MRENIPEANADGVTHGILVFKAGLQQWSLCTKEIDLESESGR
jgi:hypothetical protein